MEISVSTGLWAKISKLVFDGRTHEFRVKNEELGYPITTI
jgi:hypothetical protein